jgi:hypothetical protein
MVIDFRGERLVFSALHWSGRDGEHGAICLYACDLNGRNLKRLTPPRETTLRPLRYLRPGVTAFNILLNNRRR